MNRKLPLVSVIIVDYKKNNPYLIECLEAIERQTYKNFEIILVCDFHVDLDYPKLRQKSYDHNVGPAMTMLFLAKIGWQISSLISKKPRLLALVDRV